MGVLTKLRGRLRRRPVDPERLVARAEADRRRQALRERAIGYGGGGGGGFGAGDGGL